MSDQTFVHRPVEQVPHALETFDAVCEALGGRTPALFLDYDGTLTGIVSRPEDAVLTDDARAIVKAVADALPTAVVSGRDRPDVEKLVGIAGLIYAGSHGFDVELPEGGHLEPPVAGDWTDTLDACEAVCTRVLMRSRARWWNAKNSQSRPIIDWCPMPITPNSGKY